MRWTDGPVPKARPDRGALAREIARRARVAAVTESWSITHAAYLDVMPLYDPSGVFAELAAIVRGLPRAVFDRAIERLIVGELWEAIAKLRNARARNEPPPIASSTTS